MKILLATEYPENPEVIPGGVTAVAFNLARALSRIPGGEIHVLSRCYQQQEDRTVQLGKLTVHFFTTPKPKIGTRVVREIPKIKRLVKAIGPDIVHAHLTDYVYPCLRMGIPTAWTPHGVTAHQVQGWGTWNGRVRGLIYGRMEKESLRMARHIIAISPFIEQSFRASTRARFHSIENPVDDAFFAVRHEGIAGRLLFVGSIHPRKGLDLLIDSLPAICKSAPETTLHVLGPVLDEGYYEKIRKKTREWDLEKIVTFLGVRTGPRLVSEYDQCRFVILPSRVDTAPTVISEAMAAMRPVVAASVGGVPWMVKDGETGFLIPPEDKQLLARRTLTLLGDPERRLEMGRRAGKEAKERFCPATVAEKTLHVYEEAVGDFSRRNKGRNAPPKPYSDAAGR